MIRWGFPPNTVTYDIRIDSYSKQGRFEDGLSHLTEMEHMNYVPTLQTITTLIHGAGISHNTTKAQKLFDEIRDRNLLPDSASLPSLHCLLPVCNPSLPLTATKCAIYDRRWPFGFVRCWFVTYNDWTCLSNSYRAVWDSSLKLKWDCMGFFIETAAGLFGIAY
ncbi:Pentatricopeptide repeat-containing protein [Artemisia annua]|uniref:Pentatricopeptide repeat-containing protein n=1 Tax=Artemisia annua TaxID=35608 RepID=A0A2U1QIR5_ARTAN|nr:Pentatricopeptide repeat-containing protein [Artemisia annua]